MEDTKELDNICLKLFNKKLADVKYVHLTNYVHKQLVEDEECLRTGLYSWLAVMNGEVRQFQEVDPSEYGKYDIIHINLSGQDYHLPYLIRTQLDKEGNTRTKIVTNNDYTVELWSGSFDYPATLELQLKYSDMIFGTEPYQCGALECLTGRKVHLITHPCFVKRLKTLTPKRNLNTISVVSHRYDNYNIQPSIALKGLGPELRLIGHDPESDRKKFVTSCCYKYIMHGTNYLDFCDQLMESKVVVDPFTLTSQSRVGWDCAALGVPLIGSNRNESVRVCYPFTMCDPFDLKTMRMLTKKVLEDSEFRKKVIDYARNAVECVSYEKSREKFIRALEEGSPKINI